MKITISEELKKILPDFSIIAYQMTVNVTKTKEVDDLLDEVIKEVNAKYTIEEVVNIPKLKKSRDAYKKLGKDPSRYRLATESLIRRIAKGLGLYRINDTVDLGNILSVKTMRSVCVVDMDKIVGDIYIRIGNESDEYYGINRGHINVDKIPVYTDDLSPFGTPTSDTERTAITADTKRILVMLICFDKSDLESDEALLLDLYKKYQHAVNILKIEETLWTKHQILLKQ